MKRVQTYTLFAALLAAPLIWVAAFGGSDVQAPPSDAEIGESAPNFTLEGTDGAEYALSDLEGKFVVLEWLNFGCPYVDMHYRTGNIPGLQETYTEQDVVWLSIVSSAPGTQGHYPPDEMNARNEEHGGTQTAILMDPTGDVGRTYGAQTTPHMYIINAEGVLVYKGGIDDMPTADAAGREEATNYVRTTLDAALQGEEVSVQTAPPYGCNVKYAAQ